jgi:hypothetical protein
MLYKREEQGLKDGHGEKNCSGADGRQGSEIRMKATKER